MLEFILYNIKVAALIGVFYMFYRLLLYHKSFHRLNRIVLMATALLSFVLPLCVITFHRTVVVKDASVALDGSAVVGQAMPVADAAPSLLGRVGERLWEQSWFLWAVVGVYLLGVVLRLVLTAVRLYRLHRFIGHSEHHPLDDGITLAVTPELVAPFSWMKTIVLSRHDYQLRRTELLTHERAHIRLHHSWDVVAMELLTALQWFNPAIWMMRADLRAIHEYEADQAVLQSGVDVRRYVDLLIEKAQASSGYSLANSIKDSTLKNRIIMMTRNNNHQTWLRALYILPIAIVSLALSAKTVTDVKTVDNPRAAAKTSVAATEPSAAVAVADMPTEVENVMDALETNDDKDPKNIVVVDGKTVSDLAGINPQDIANIEVLKGDQITKKFGKAFADTKDTRVICVTLKKGATIDDADASAADKAYDVVDVLPEFPGGTPEMMKFLITNLQYPVAAQNANVAGRVICQFVVEKDGSIDDVKIAHNGTQATKPNKVNTAEGKTEVKPAPTEAEIAAGKQALADEAIRLVKAMPKWTPGTQKGEPVRVKYTIPVRFSLQ